MCERALGAVAEYQSATTRSCLAWTTAEETRQVFDGGGWWVIFPIIGLVFMLLMMSRMFGFRRRSSDRGMGPRIPRTPGLAMPETQQPLRAGGGG